MSDWSPGELLIIDLTHNDWMDLRGSLNQLLDFKLLVLRDLIEDHEKVKCLRPACKGKEEQGCSSMV